jgi:hypothetical protein
MLENTITTLLVLILWFEIYQVFTWHWLLMKKPFGCQICLPAYFYVLISILPIYMRELIMGISLTTIIYYLLNKQFRK